MISSKERDKQTVKLMIQMYCKHRLKTSQIPEKYRQLINYANTRLDHCSWGKDKPACKDCPHHCFLPEKQKEIREVMKWSGPRMLIWSPRSAFRHLLQLYHDRLSSRHIHAHNTHKK
nr:nitrous oxide-stimulated promoter family protein [Prevotella sp.]